MKNISNILLCTAAAALLLLTPSLAFSPSVKSSTLSGVYRGSQHFTTTQLFERFTEERKKKLGLGDSDDEYDLGMALEANTDPLISKIIAGSFILVMISLLVAGVIVPYTTDYGDGVCNPLLTAGRC